MRGYRHALVVSSSASDRESKSANEFRSSLGAAIIHHNDFETRRILLLAQGFQTMREGTPIIVDSYDNAEFWS